MEMKRYGWRILFQVFILKNYKEGTPYTERALPMGTDKKPYTVFEVVKPVEVDAGKIAPWFGEKGGGIQYEFQQKISELIEQGILRKVG